MTGLSSDAAPYHRRDRGSTVSIFVSVLPPNPPLWMIVAILVIVFANEATWYSIVAFGLSAAQPRAIYLRLQGVLDHAMAALLGALGVKLLVDAARRA